MKSAGNGRGLNMLELAIPYREFCAIHLACGYDQDPATEHLFRLVGNELQGASWADVNKAPSFAAYCEAADEYDNR
jgi:hypothetical protein